MNPRPYSLPRHGFTLVELLTVIAIVGILASIIIVSIGKVRASARDTRCLSNLRQIGILFTLYRADNDNRLPVDIQVDQATNATRTWDNYLKDYLQNSSTGARAADVFGCPSVVPDANTLSVQSSYGINYHLGSNQTPRLKIPFTSIARPSETFLVTDSDDRAFRRDSQSLMQNGNSRYDIPPVERHSRRFNMLYADGSVRILNFNAMPWGATHSGTEPPWGPGS
ncbi:MAG: prepilin-type N-terminal cleavage/methylation domain-containing protein [Verrucomicrobiota bacterium]